MAIDTDRAGGGERWRARQLTVGELAEGIVAANSERGAGHPVVSVERGHDPRRFALVAFSGAGMHAQIARKLKSPPSSAQHAGLLSPLGMLVADVTRDYSAGVCGPVTRSPCFAPGCGRLSSGRLRTRPRRFHAAARN
jgi:N-methylhydantoinase A